MDSFLIFSSGLVKLAIRAETLLALLMALALLALIRGLSRAGRVFLSLALTALLSIGMFPLGQLILTPLERQYASAPALSGIEGIVLLGGSEDTGPSERWSRPLVNSSGDRYLTTLELALRFPQARVLVTGGGETRAGAQEVPLAEMLLGAAGIPRQRLLLETRARNTAENAYFSREIIGEKAAGPWVLVTSAFHMPRAVASFCAAGWSGLVPWPTDYRTSSFWDSVGWDLPVNMDNLNKGIKEWVGLLAYRLTGRVGSFNPEGCLASEAMLESN